MRESEDVAEFMHPCRREVHGCPRFRRLLERWPEVKRYCVELDVRLLDAPVVILMEAGDSG